MQLKKGMKSDPLNIVLVLGESSRGSHYSLNGYKKKTNPLLEKRKNLVNFSNATACAPSTRLTVPCLMTSAERGEIKNEREELQLHTLANFGYLMTWFKVGSTL